MAEIIGIGSAVFDTLMTADGFPQEDTKIEGTQTRVQGGGPCATALVAAGKLGVSSAYWGTLGDDLYGRSIQENLDAKNFYAFNPKNDVKLIGYEHMGKISFPLAQ